MVESLSSPIDISCRKVKKQPDCVIERERRSILAFLPIGG
jgi:hypothetical protein